MYPQIEKMQRFKKIDSPEFLFRKVSLLFFCIKTPLGFDITTYRGLNRILKNFGTKH